MKATTFISLAQSALRKFRHKEYAECASELPDLISNPKTGAIGVGCLKCGRIIEVTRVDAPDCPIVLPGEEVKVKPRFKLP